MFDVILGSLLASFFLILLGVGMYIRFREKINNIPTKEKINELIMHVQKYRYWYLAATVIVLAPIFHYYLDSVLNPPRFKPPPEIYVPPPQQVDNRDSISLLSKSFLMAFQLFSPCIVIFIAPLSLVLILRWKYRFNQNDFIYQSLTKMTTTIILFAFGFYFLAIWVIMYMILNMQ